MWFSKKDIKKHKSIKLKDLKGYVLPHAGTTHTGDIISHTLRFKPTKKINKIIIIYCPSQNKPNVGDYYHEYYVPMMCLKMFFKDAEIIGINILEEKPKINLDDFIVVSADFSHFLDMKNALYLENKASHSLMFRDLSDTNYNKVIDDKRSFEYLYSNIPLNYNLQWVGRTRSEGEKGVGYLSYLIRDTTKYKKNPSMIIYNFYDQNMNLIDTKHSKKKLNIKRSSNIEEKNFKYVLVQNLHRDKRKEFIRGWNTLKIGKRYVTPEIFLEKTYENGSWIRPSDKEWSKTKKFKLTETLKKMNLLNKINKTHKKKTTNKSDKKIFYYSEMKIISF